MYINRKLVVAIVAIVGVIGIVMIANAANNDGGTQDTKVSKNIEDRRDAFPGPGNSLVKTDVATCPQDYHVDNGKEFDVPPGCNVKGDVAVLEDGKWVNKYDNDANTGLVISCPQGCKIKAPWGANVTPRDVEDIKTELLSSGCGAKCTSVTVVVINGSDKDGGSTPNPSPSPSPATPSVTPTTQPINDGCEPELKLGEKRVIAKGCIVVGDVFVRPAGSSEDFHPVFDNRKDTGTVHLLTEDTEVWNLQGASIMPAGMKLEDIVMATKLAGCGTGYGCPEGILDWNGKRLDQ